MIVRPNISTRKYPLLLFILMMILPVLTAYATSPAKPGVIPSQRVQEFTTVMAEEYAKGGLVAKMQRIKQANIELAESGSRDLREDVHMSFPVILGSYSDVTDYSSVITGLQAELFDGPWPTVTMAEHYEEMSYNQFHLSGTVYGWYELENAAAYYEGSQSLPYDNGFIDTPEGVGGFLQESLILADPDIDFTLYDNDGPDGVPNSGDDDGVVDAAFFGHSGSGGESGGPAIWSHRYSYAAWWGAPYTTDDMGANGSAILVNDYIMQPTQNTSEELIEIGVFSHEFGHALGLPDLYDTDYSSDGVGNWCLMGSGSWTSPDSPTHMSAWCKEMMGWVVPIVPNENMTAVEILNAEENGYALKLWTNGEVDPYESPFGLGLEVGEEYYLVENRQRLGTEQHLVGTGIILWHVDNTQFSNSDESHRLVDLVSADGISNGESPSDPWPGTTNNRTFDYQTYPAAISYAGENTEVSIFNISDLDTIMYIDLELTETYPHLYVTGQEVFDNNGDGFFSPNESGEIWLSMTNYGITTTGVTATIIPESNTDFNFLSSEVTFADLAFDTPTLSSLPFEFTVTSNSTGTVSFQVAISNLITASIDTATIELVIGDPEIALVDQDGVVSGEGDVKEYFLRPAQDLDKVHAYWDVAADGLPTEEWLLSRPILIWFTGNTEMPLTPEVIGLLKAYQDNGGRLLLTGQDLTDGDSTQADFIADYCAATYEETVSDVIYIFGNPEHEIMSGTDQYIANNYFGANNQTSPDIVGRLPHGKSLFTYPRSEYRSAGTTTIQNGYKTVFMAFGFESLAPLDDEAWEIRTELMNRIFNWFNLDYVALDPVSKVLPTDASITSFYPNPFNPSVTISYSLPEDMIADLSIFDIRGREITRIASGSHTVGQHEVVWNALGESGEQVQTGVYFARLNAGNQSETIKLVYLK